MKTFVWQLYAKSNSTSHDTFYLTDLCKNKHTTYTYVSIHMHIYIYMCISLYVKSLCTVESIAMFTGSKKTHHRRKKKKNVQHQWFSHYGSRTIPNENHAIHGILSVTRRANTCHTGDYAQETNMCKMKDTKTKQKYERRAKTSVHAKMRHTNM